VERLCSSEESNGCTITGMSKQLNALDDWITEKASRDVAQHFVSAILSYIDGILLFPLAGRARDDVRPGHADNHLQEADAHRLRGRQVLESSGDSL
jgi:plasmid stabilization system protein ParE